MTWARRIAERDLDCLRLGTAIGISSFDIEAAGGWK
jgi:hypothetical protein